MLPKGEIKPSHLKKVLLRERQEIQTQNGTPSNEQEEPKKAVYTAPYEAMRNMPKPAVSTPIRHYVHQLMTDVLSQHICTLFAAFEAFHQRAKMQTSNPMKAKQNRRYEIGLHQSASAVANGKAKLIIIAPNIDESRVEEGLNEQVGMLVDACLKQSIPYVYAFSQKKLGNLVGTKRKVSVVAVTNIANAHQEYQQLLSVIDFHEQISMLQHQATQSARYLTDDCRGK